MFNLNQHKEAQITSGEKYLRRDNVGPKADDGQAIWEKELPHRTGVQDTITEDQFGKVMEEQSNDITIIEKVLNEAQSYVTHRSDQAETSVMPINAVVEKMRQNRMEDWKTEKSSRWSQTFDEKKQQGSLPKWKKNFEQHDKVVLNNDPARFEPTQNLPVHADQPKNDAARSRSNTIIPLIGGITTADIHRVADHIKSGASVDFDTAIIAMLREAEKEERELTPVEQKTVSELKIARTEAMFKK